MQVFESQPLAPHWSLGPRGLLRLDRPRIMVIVNLTPDSFSDGGKFREPAAAVEFVAAAVESGADLVDIGGESTRPGAGRVDAAEQTRRTVPVIEGVRRLAGAAGQIPISIDTTLAPVAAAALDAGADVINDVSAGTEDPSLLALVAGRGAGLVLMHRLTSPERDRYSDRYDQPPRYLDVVREVGGFLAARAAAAERAGVARGAIAIDPGLGFGKTVGQNLELVRRTGELASLGYPIVSGASRKSFTGRAMGLVESRPDERLMGSIAISVTHLGAGARIFRVHDAAEQRGALFAAARAMGIVSADP